MYKTFYEGEVEDKNVFYFRSINYCSIDNDSLNINSDKRLNEVRKFKEKYKLKPRELSQQDFLNMLFENNEFEVKNIIFKERLEQEDKEEIYDLLRMKKFETLISKIKTDSYYFQIKAIELFLIKERIEVEILQMLQLHITYRGTNCYKDNGLLKYIDTEKILKKIPIFGGN